jgi:protein SCO1/2
MENKKTITAPILFFTILFIFSLFALLVVEFAEESRNQIPVYDQVPDFTFMESRGQQFGLQDLKGKLSIIDFFFTTCRGPCPLMSKEMEKLYNYYLTTDKVQFVSISVDPKRDSLSVLRAYAERYGVIDNRWNFLNGDIEEVKRLSEEGFKLGADFPDMHNTNFILVDHKGIIRGYYDPFNSASMKLLKTQIRQIGKRLQ